jgi:hypothetical protein
LCAVINSGWGKRVMRAGAMLGEGLRWIFFCCFALAVVGYLAPQILVQVLIAPFDSQERELGVYLGTTLPGIGDTLAYCFLIVLCITVCVCVVQKRRMKKA